MSSCGSSSGLGFDFTERSCDGVGNLQSLIVQSHLRVTDLQRETEQEIIRVRQQLRSVRLQQKILNCETPSLETLQTEAEHSQQRAVNTETCTCFSASKRELPRCIVGKAAHFERLRFREQALVALLSMLGEDVQRYRQESTRLDYLTDKLTNGMPGKSQQDSSMGTDSKDSLHISEHAAELSNGHVEGRTTMEDDEKNWKANKKGKGTNLTRSGSVKDLIHKFSVSDGEVLTAPNGSPTLAVKRSHDSGNPLRASDGAETPKERETPSPIPAVTVTPPSGQSGKLGNAGLAALSNGPDFELDREKNLDRPPSEEGPITPRIPLNPKYQLYLGGDRIGNGASGPGGPMSTGANGTVSKTSITRRSMESLVSRDWDSSSDKVESPPRVFNSPYSTISIEYNPVSRMSDYKVPELSPATSEINLFGLTRSTSPVSTPTLQSPRPRFSAYETLSRRREQAPPSQLLMRSNLPNKRDYIEELTKQMEDYQKRNQFLEAESIELEKERTQIRFEMRGLLVNNEDLLRVNAQLQGELKRMRDRIVELESNNNVMVERFRQMEVELKEAREVMVEANTQEYAFNFLQQSLKNKIQDAEDALEKQTQHAQSLSEKLWLAERNLEELELEKDTKGKKAVELGTTVNKLETELAEALQQAAQANTELSLQHKLRMDTQLRVEELEESVLEKDQEVLRLQQIINRLQGEVSDKLLEKEQLLEEEIQLREKKQLQWKQAERTVEDLQMELQTVTQARDDLTKQVKQLQEKVIDMETDLEEMQENEQRWAGKNKKALEQCEQIQMKLIQEKDLNDKLECEKVILERQIRELNSEIEELQNNKVHEHVITKAETRAKELENALRAEERSKVALNNTIGKLERKVNELTEQLDEEHRISNEQKDLMTQRMRSLKRQLNEVEEQASRRDSQYRHTQRELTEEREASARLQKQLLEMQLQMKRKDTMMMRQTLDNLKLNLSGDEEDEPNPAESSSAQN